MFVFEQLEKMADRTWRVTVKLSLQKKTHFSSKLKNRAECLAASGEISRSWTARSSELSSVSSSS